MYERAYSGNIVIACQGPAESQVVDTPYGEMRSRSGAKLKYVRADGQLVYKKWTKDSSIPAAANVYLEDPTRDEVKQAIAKVLSALSGFPQDAIGIDFYFAGHGRLIDGAWILKDDAFTAKMLCDTMENNLKNGAGECGLSMIIDSCYSGAFLINFMIQMQQSVNLDFRDGLFSSLPHEKSWELSFLGHGAFTYTHMNKGNKNFDADSLTRAIEQNDYNIIAKYTQGMIGAMANPTAYLTQGRQHTIDVSKGCYINIPSYGHYSIFKKSMDESIDFSKVATDLRAIVDRYK